MYTWGVHLRSKRLKIRSLGEREEMPSLCYSLFFFFSFIKGFCRRFISDLVYCCWPVPTVHTTIMCALQMVTIYLYCTFPKRLCHSDSLAIHMMAVETHSFICNCKQSKIHLKTKFPISDKGSHHLPSVWYDTADSLYYINHVQIPQKLAYCSLL